MRARATPTLYTIHLSNFQQTPLKLVASTLVVVHGKLCALSTTNDNTHHPDPGVALVGVAIDSLEHSSVRVYLST